MDNRVFQPPIKFVKKGWGYELWIVNKPEYCGKLLFFNEGKKCSWHYHILKDEVFYKKKIFKLILVSLKNLFQL